jgi:peptide-methionine (S)-S-oxide reductase
MSGQAGLETATLAGGCFWCLEAVFREVEGVEGVQSGYTGGTKANPTYEQVCSGKTGHAEAVRIAFDPRKITYKEILEIFFSAHDPTTLNRQGADVGTQYRSAIFYHSEAQKTAAEEIIREMTAAHAWKYTIVTQVLPAGEFYPAEEYHDSYFERHPASGYCQVVIAPKLEKFRKKHTARLKKV